MFAKSPIAPSAAAAKMKIVVGTESDLKLAAVRSIFKNAEVIGVATNSGVPEQPQEDETRQGARNRLDHARKQIPNADMYIAIENGIFNESGHYIDRAVILLGEGNSEVMEYSSGVEFPEKYYLEAKALGFDRITVGEVMFKAGIVRNKKDPHADLGEKTPRQAILKATIETALTKLNSGPLFRR